MHGCDLYIHSSNHAMSDSPLPTLSDLNEALSGKYTSIYSPNVMHNSVPCKNMFVSGIDTYTVGVYLYYSLVPIDSGV